MGLIQGVLRLTRLYNLIIIALCQLLLASNIEDISMTQLLYDWRFLAMVISTLMIAAGGNVINDYYDVKIDYINKPEKVVVGRTVSRRWTMLFHAFLSYGGIIIGLLVSWRLAVADTLIVIMLWYYSNRLKCVPLWGNMAVGVLTAMVVMVIPMYFGNMKLIYIAFAVFAFIITMIRELTKDLEDVRGDLKFGCNTYPKIYGLRKSIKLLVFFEVVFLLSLGVTLFFNPFELQIYTVMTLIVPTLYLIFKSSKSKHRDDFSLLSFLDKIIILFGLFSAFLL